MLPTGACNQGTYCPVLATEAARLWWGVGEKRGHLCRTVKELLLLPCESGRTASGKK